MANYPIDFQRAQALYRFVKAAHQQNPNSNRGALARAASFFNAAADQYAGTGTTRARITRALWLVLFEKWKAGSRWEHSVIPPGGITVNTLKNKTTGRVYVEMWQAGSECAFFMETLKPRPARAVDHVLLTD